MCFENTSPYFTLIHIDKLSLHLTTREVQERIPRIKFDHTVTRKDSVTLFTQICWRALRQRKARNRTLRGEKKVLLRNKVGLKQQ